MTTSLLVNLAVLVLLGPAALAFLLRRRRPAIPFLKAYGSMLPGFLLSALLKAAYPLTGRFFFEVAAPVAMVAGVLAGIRFLGRTGR